ncbi:MAG: hypothetical protein IJH65_04345 [Methanobrevibacter sp.]|nr:hypothetical protein [Methanobrevibacter sp.]
MRQIHCKYCGKLFEKTHNRQIYCSEECFINARRERNSKCQAKRRLMAKNGDLVLPEQKKYGLGSYGTSHRHHPLEDPEREYESIQREMRWLKLKDKRKEHANL